MEDERDISAISKSQGSGGRGGAIRGRKKPWEREKSLILGTHKVKEGILSFFPVLQSVVVTFPFLVQTSDQTPKWPLGSEKISSAHVIRLSAFLPTRALVGLQQMTTWGVRQGPQGCPFIFPVSPFPFPC